MFYIVGGYASQIGCKVEEKEKFWMDLWSDKNYSQGGECGQVGVSLRNREGQMLVDFTKRMEITVVNTYLPKERT